MVSVSCPVRAASSHGGVLVTVMEGWQRTAGQQASVRRKNMRRLALPILLLGSLASLAAAADQPAPASRPVRTNEMGAGFRPPDKLPDWEARRQVVRRRILGSCGLLP